jgi:hypothetical protein
LFGEVSGCVNAVKEDRPCGETSACAACVLRHSLIQTLIADAPVDRKPLDRVFFIKGQAVQIQRVDEDQVGFYMLDVWAMA